jgi:hypothetical protein
VRSAPAVSVRCTGGPAWHLAQALLPAVAAAALAAWMLGHAGVTLAPAGLIGLAVAAVAWRLTPRRAVQLAWDGQTWSADGQPVRLAVMLDIGGWLLLRLQPGRGPHAWQPLSAAEAGPALHALRCALYARAGDADAAAPRAR